MVLAYDYPLLSIMWTIFVIFLWVAWIILIFRVFGDIFRRDMSGVSKAVWSILVILLPYVGVFAYLVVNGGGMVERDVASMEAQEKAFQDYVRQSTGAQMSVADELEKLAGLRDRGVLTAEEFETRKAQLLG